MSVPQTFNGVSYPIPTQGDLKWGPPLTRYLVALGSFALSTGGGVFTLAADIDFGSSFGLLTPYYKSKSANIASAGVLRLSNTDLVEWRNFANGGNNTLGVNVSDQLVYNGSTLEIASLTNSHIFVGNVGNIPTDVAMSGDTTIANTGAVTIVTGAVTNAKIAASTGITLNKLAALNTAIVPITDGSGFLTSSSTTTTELGYVHGVTSAIQTQLNTLTSNQALYLLLTGGTMSGAIAMGSNKITGLAVPTTTADALSWAQAANVTTLTVSGLLTSTANITTTGQLGVQLSGGFSTGAVIQSGTGQNRFTQWSLAMALAPGSGNGHGIGDYSTWNGAASSAYASVEGNGATIGSTNFDHIAGFQANNSHQSSGTLNKLYGFVSVPVSSGGLVTNMYGYVSDHSAANAVTNAYHFYAQNENGSTINGTQAAFYSEALTKGNPIYGVYIAGTANPSYFAGGVYANEAPPASAIMSAASTTQGFLPPRMTTTQRDAISSPAEGLFIYNTSTHHPNYWNGSAWTQL